MSITRATESRPTVLLVEDDADTAKALSQALAAAGFDVRVCHDGPTALLQARELAPFAAVVDIRLSAEMDGYELGQRLRTELGPALRLFALTGFDGDDDRKRAADASFDAFMVKPADIAQLVLWLQADHATWATSGYGPLTP